MVGDELYQMSLIPSLYHIPIGSYRGNSLTSLLKVPNLFIGEVVAQVERKTFLLNM